MNKFFPNIETAIIVVFILCVMLWGASRCKRQKEDLATRAVTEGSATLPDTLASPAAARPTPKALPPIDPNLTTTTPAPQYSPTPPANPGQAVPQVVPQQNTPSSYSTPAPAKAPRTASTPTVTTVETAPAAVVQQTGSALYVLRSGLNVRAKPNVKSKSLGKLKLHDQVYFLDEVSPTAETVRLENGTEVTKPWFKVKTKKGTVGWVHGSGVDFYKRKPQDVF